jgi:hypothetical protein
MQKISIHDHLNELKILLILRKNKNEFGFPPQTFYTLKEELRRYLAPFRSK